MFQLHKSKPSKNVAVQVAQAATTLVGFVVGSEFVFGRFEAYFEILQWISLVPTLILAVFLLLIPNTPSHYLKRECWLKG